MKKKPKYEPDEIVNVYTWKSMPFKDVERFIPRLKEFDGYYINQDWHLPTPIDKKPSNKPDNKK